MACYLPRPALAIEGLRKAKISLGGHQVNCLLAEQYPNIEGPKTAQIIPSHPKQPRRQPFSHQLHPLSPDYLANSVGGPEKAGVGGSIPSLATI